jgi:hypothetical protein
MGIFDASFKKINTGWSQAAEELGLSFVPGNLLRGARIHGDLDGFVETTGSTTSSHTSTRYRVDYPSVGLDFELRSRSMPYRAFEAFGPSDVLIGDEEFDERFHSAPPIPMRSGCS